jgi:hypothetical protein
MYKAIHFHGNFNSIKTHCVRIVYMQLNYRSDRNRIIFYMRNVEFMNFYVRGFASLFKISARKILQTVQILLADQRSSISVISLAFPLSVAYARQGHSTENISSAIEFRQCCLPLRAGGLDTVMTVVVTKVFAKFLRGINKKQFRCGKKESKSCACLLHFHFHAISESC